VTPPAICFDATGTLIKLAEGVGDVYHRIALEYGVDLPAWRLEDAFRRILARAPPRGVEGDTINARRQNEVDWWFERIRETFQATDSTARFDDFPTFAAALFEFYRSPDAWRPRAGIPAALAVLRARFCPIAVVSNFDHRLPEILEGLDLSRFIEHIEIPSISGSSKPDQTLFQRVATKLERPIDEFVYIGDDAPEVLEAIAALGLRVFDVREMGNLEALSDLASTAATLPPPR
jgi:putative hydrolase of the HAD superfamily